YHKAIEHYQKLLTLQKTQPAKANTTKTLVNLAYCKIQQQQAEEALTLLQEADDQLQAAFAPGREKEDSEEEEEEEEEVTAEKTAFYFDEMLVLETFRAAAFRQLGRSDSLLAGYRRKLNLLQAKKEWGEDELGKDRKYLAFELSVLHNEMASLALQLGLLDQ